MSVKTSYLVSIFILYQITSGKLNFFKFPLQTTALRLLSRTWFRHNECSDTDTCLRIRSNALEPTPSARALQCRGRLIQPRLGDEIRVDRGWKICQPYLNPGLKRVADGTQGRQRVEKRHRNQGDVMPAGLELRVL